MTDHDKTDAAAPHPYADLPQDRFWRTAVADRSPFQIRGLWKPRFRIRRRTRIITAGSCFAQHISRALVQRNYKWIDAEPAPTALRDTSRRDFHYGTFSFRTGNIYTPKMLHQWVSWAAGTATPPEITWEKDGRFYDPFRPAVEPGGFATAAELFQSRAVTIAAVRRAVEQASVFVFTLGLTEAWEDAEGGFEYALCPGTIAGRFDAAAHRFVNHGFRATFGALKAAMNTAREMNPNLRFLLTVSPVPLTATASDDHVLTATSQSKSVLRAVAGEMKAMQSFVDYFPSYEIITHPAFRGMFFDPNMRTVDPKGVAFVMDAFFQDQFDAFAKTVQVQAPYGETVERVIGPEDAAPDADGAGEAETAEDIRCEEEMLDAFST